MAALAVVIVVALFASALVAFAQISADGVVGASVVSSTLIFITRSVAAIVAVFLAIGTDVFAIFTVVLLAIVALWLWSLSYDIVWFIAAAVAHQSLEETELAVPVGANAVGRAVSALSIDDGFDASEKGLFGVAPFGVVALDFDGRGTTAFASEFIEVAVELVHALGEISIDSHSLFWIRSLILDSVKGRVGGLDVLPAAKSTASSRETGKELKVEIEAK